MIERLPVVSDVQGSNTGMVIDWDVWERQENVWYELMNTRSVFSGIFVNIIILYYYNALDSPFCTYPKTYPLDIYDATFGYAFRV